MSQVSGSDFMVEGCGVIPEFPTDWKVLPIETCMAAIIDYRGKSPRKAPSGVPLITAKIVKDGRILPPEEYICEEDYEEWMRRGIPEPGDVLMTTEAPLGEIAQLDDTKVALAQRLITLRGKPGVLDNRFLKFAMQSQFVQQQLKARATGTTVGGVRQSELRKVQLAIPPVSEQRAIAHILGTLDDKIELNRRMNETLEAMARAIFKSWFVDFDPVHAKSEGRQPSGMDATTAALFPGSFEDSPLGRIPKSWRVTTLADFALLNPEVWAKQNPPITIEYVDLSNVKWGRIEATMPHPWNEAPSRAQRVLRRGDSIVGTVRPGNGSYAFISDNGLTGSTGFAVLRPRKSSFREIVYLAATNPDNIERLAHLADGAAYPAVRPDAVQSTQIIVAPDPIIELFSQMVRPLLAKYAASNRESHALAATRDVLLPKLISGEVRVSAVNRFAETIA